MSEPPRSMDRFDDGKAPDAMRTIGEVSAAFGIKPHVLRYWEQQFDKLEPLKRSGGRRLYRPEDIALLDRIDRLVNQQGYTLKGANKALKQGEGAAVQVPHNAAAEPVSVSPDKGEADRDVLARLYSVRDRLANGLRE
tara:strand:- start:313 stop:726 length:414 start_codon:yes stop_codon:yes gene_type:complete